MKMIADNKELYCGLSELLAVHSRSEDIGWRGFLVIMDHFSRRINRVPLSALPSELEMAELLFNQVFQNYGIPEDILSDWGPQFISRVWAGFMEKLQ